MRSSTRLGHLARIALIGLTLPLTATWAFAQAPAPVAIDPGMTRDEVVARLGTPSGESHAGSFTYLFYDNGCAARCGIDDVVVLERNIVTDAMFRSRKRAFTGVSSSPQELSAAPAGHVGPEPLRASTSDDSAHRGGIVFAQPHPIAQPPRYVRIIPNRADSARMAQPSAGGAASATGTDSAATTPH